MRRSIPESFGMTYTLPVFPAEAGIQRHLPINRGRHLGSGFRRSDEYTAKGPIDAFDTGVLSHFYCGEPWCGATPNYLGPTGRLVVSTHLLL